MADVLPVQRAAGSCPRTARRRGRRSHEADENVGRLYRRRSSSGGDLEGVKDEGPDQAQSDQDRQDHLERVKLLVLPISPARR